MLKNNVCKINMLQVEATTSYIHPEPMYSEMDLAFSPVPAVASYEQKYKASSKYASVQREPTLYQHFLLV